MGLPAVEDGGAAGAAGAALRVPVGRRRGHTRVCGLPVAKCERCGNRREGDRCGNRREGHQSIVEWHMYRNPEFGEEANFVFVLKQLGDQ